MSKKERIAATGSFDPLTEEYALSISSGSLIVSFDFLGEEDLHEILSCIKCLLPSED
jgi:hypothetical protein